MPRILAVALLPLMLLAGSISLAVADPVWSRSVPLVVAQNGSGPAASRTGFNGGAEMKDPPVRQGERGRPAPATKEDMSRFLGVAFVILGSCTTILFVLGCGSRVVVFANRSDAVMSAGMIFAPIVTVLASAVFLLLFQNSDVKTKMTMVEFGKAYPPVAFFIVVGGLWWVWSILGTLVSSIRHNGLILGLIVSALKVGAVLSFLIVGWVALTNYDDEDSLNHYTAKFVIFAILAWFASKMVNGKRVRRRRMASNLTHHFA